MRHSRDMQMPVAQFERSAVEKSLPDEDRCWKAVRKRDRSQDGQWFAGVITTGVYCRPSCPSRAALRKNVRFYATSQEAERDGLRPCLRCRPLEAVGNAVAEKMRDLCRYIDTHSDARLNLQELAGRAGLSLFHLQRTFKA